MTPYEKTLRALRGAKASPVVATADDGTEVLAAPCPDCRTRCPKWVAREERCGKTFAERMGGVVFPTFRGPAPLADDAMPDEAEQGPYVCPGCYAVGPERCAVGCPDAEREARNAFEIEYGEVRDDWDEP